MNHQELYSDIRAWVLSQSLSNVLYDVSHTPYQVNFVYIYRTKESFLATLNAFT